MSALDDDLVAIIAAQDKRIKELEDGSCRFHCRTIREAFKAGYMADLQHYEQGDEGVIQAEEIAYRAWRGE